MVDDYIEVLFDNNVLVTERLTLRKFTKDDASDVLEYASDVDRFEYLSWKGVQTIEEAQKNIVEYYWSRPGIYAIELNENKKCIGCIELRLCPEHDKTSFAYILNYKYWNNGYATEALLTVLKFCFEKLDFNRVEALYYDGNDSSGKVMKKCGMELEGVGKQEKKIKGVFRDVVHYGITKERWLSLK